MNQLHNKIKPIYDANKRLIVGNFPDIEPKIIELEIYEADNSYSCYKNVKIRNMFLYDSIQIRIINSPFLINKCKNYTLDPGSALFIPFSFEKLKLKKKTVITYEIKVRDILFIQKQPVYVTHFYDDKNSPKNIVKGCLWQLLLYFIGSIIILLLSFILH